jgi:hypothetical protein
MPPVFRHLPATSLDDCTHNFEQLQSEWAALIAAGDASPALLLNELVRRRITFGESEATFVVARSSGEVEVEHKLGVTPKVVFITTRQNQLFGCVTAVAATKFTAILVDGVENANGTFKFYWAAIG